MEIIRSFISPLLWLSLFVSKLWRIQCRLVSSMKFSYWIDTPTKGIKNLLYKKTTIWKDFLYIWTLKESRWHHLKEILEEYVAICYWMRSQGENQISSMAWYAYWRHLSCSLCLFRIVILAAYVYSLRI